MSFYCYIQNNDSELIKYNIKLKQCPYCGKYGMLILHGYIRGHDEERNPVIKGRRVYCSNRNRRKGCGRTLSFRLCSYIRQSFISAHTAWKFLSNVLTGSSIEGAYNSLDPSFSVSLAALYILWKKLRYNIAGIRTLLSSKLKLTQTHQDCPVRETLFYLKQLAHEGCTNPIEAYHIIFQSTPF